MADKRRLSNRDLYNLYDYCRKCRAEECKKTESCPYSTDCKMNLRADYHKMMNKLLDDGDRKESRKQAAAVIMAGLYLLALLARRRAAMLYAHKTFLH